MPKTKLGKWACVLLIVFLVSFIALIIFLNVLGFKRGSVELVVPGIFMTISGLATFVTGAISLFKFKDRSLLVIIATIFGFLAFLRFVMELV
ncbi:MAG: hypothetical protein ABIN18_07805 [Pseudomonadota bacterium]